MAKHNSFDLIVTLGPSLQQPEKLRAIADSGATIFRINGAHSGPEQIQSIVTDLRETLPTARVMIDLPGNKIRTARLDVPIRLVNGEVIELSPQQVNFPDFHKYLKTGDSVHANDNIYHLEVVGIRGQKLKLLSHSDGTLLSNKGLHVSGIHGDIPFLFQRDADLIAAGVGAKVDFISLSFVRTAADVREAQALLEKQGAKATEIFTKIETKSALENLPTILETGDSFNIDRGDLSSDVGLLALPQAIDMVIKACQAKKKRIFLATQFLKNMEQFPTPLLSEVVDMHRVLKAGINGLQLSEETAVGRYPVECVRFVFEMLKEARRP